MYQSLVEGRPVPWGLLVKDVPPDKHQDLDYLVEQLDWEGNVNPALQGQPLPGADPGGRHRLARATSIAGSSTARSAARSCSRAKELTVDPGVQVTIKDNGAYGLIAVQGSGKIGKLALQTPAMIRFGELTEDEVFVSRRGGAAGRRLRKHGHRAAGDAALLRAGHEPGRAGGRRL